MIQTANRWDHPPICDPLALLIEAGADVNGDPELPGLLGHGSEVGPRTIGAAPGFTALMRAVIEQNIEVVKFLLRHGATLDAGIEVRMEDARITAQQDGSAEALADYRELRHLQTVEDYCDLEMYGLAGSELNEGHAMLKFLRDFRAAGGTAKAFLWEPRADLCMLRLLCERGRSLSGTSSRRRRSPRLRPTKERRG